jgi:hypothetical protein
MVIYVVYEIILYNQDITIIMVDVPMIYFRYYHDITIVDWFNDMDHDITIYYMTLHVIT